jgi:hypothetical protein
MRCARCEEWQRICENLESQIAGLREDAADRIEALEAALREIGDPLTPYRVDGVGRAWEQATIQVMQKLARAALAPE